jgi:TPR repeat protein
MGGRYARESSGVRRFGPAVLLLLLSACAAFVANVRFHFLHGPVQAPHKGIAASSPFTQPAQPSPSPAKASSARPRAPVAHLPAFSPDTVPAASSGGGNAEYSAGMSRLRQDDPMAHAEAAQHLWNAIMEGSVPAEAALARLYLQGDGVEKNCDQAQVLLDVAAKKNNEQAVQLLNALRAQPCR